MYKLADPSARAALYREVAQTIQNDAVTVFLVNETAYDAYNPKIKNYRTHPLNYYTLTPTLSVD
jgi:peptide/nickel transport system substrate-binding protein